MEVLNIAAFTEEFELKKKKFNEDNSKLIDSLIDSLQNLSSLAHKQMDFYRARHTFVKEKFKIQNRISFIVSYRNEYEGELLKNRKGVSNNIESNFSDFILKNDYERNVAKKYEMKDIDYLIEKMQNHLTFVNDCIATIDKLLYGIPYVIELDKSKYELKT
jgi:hypothetical protein